MPHVHVHVTMRAALEDVWQTVADVESYPLYMDTVSGVEVLRDLPDGSRLTSWSVVLKGCPLEWTEREVARHDTHRLEFEQVEGDLEVFRGAWSVVDEGGGLVGVRLECEFDVGIPLLAEMLNPVAARALTENSEAMLAHVQQRVAA